MEWLRRRMRRRSYVMRVEELKRRIGSILYRSILLCFFPVHAFVGRGVGEAEGFRVRRGWRAATDQQAPSQSYLVSQSSGSNPADVRARTWEIFLPGKNVVFRRRKNSMLRMLAALKNPRRVSCCSRRPRAGERRTLVCRVCVYLMAYVWGFWTRERLRASLGRDRGPRL